ncbi:MAG: hypothetical protein DWQ19_10075 [Crenarchaeota archaeon]|nr:MAG: hypothetical protein DWQ19_10075 [Thermoproteota archaeon]
MKKLALPKKSCFVSLVVQRVGSQKVSRKRLYNEPKTAIMKDVEINVPEASQRIACLGPPPWGQKKFCPQVKKFVNLNEFLVSRN